ncbi:hypothetical protein [Rhodovulum adriaticum]|uniref:Uncharacterized protein n=1 Tax=Rhodovulum adriaticum TaxID=35804 RepID=A0A4R2NTY3_RHOAD|nr:hypothetical protein [Rhodovulum adriaticum]MBK1635024.1 hypothetical protein [Rhodovulum adriaticum]TCP25342.1 hypothetical protein EV656_10391 [Rhodovulum adriaticum]
MEQKTGHCPFAAQHDTITGHHPIRIGRSVMNREILRPVLRQAGVSEMPFDPHVLVASCPCPVDWDAAAFAPEHNRIAISPRKPRLVRTPEDTVALAFDADELSARWKTLTEAGAHWTGAAYVPQIVLGPAPDDLPETCFFSGPILFGPEWRKTPDCA